MHLSFDMAVLKNPAAHVSHWIGLVDTDLGRVPAGQITGPTWHIQRVRSFPELMLFVNASSSSNRVPAVFPSLNAFDIAGLDAMPCM